MNECYMQSTVKLPTSPLNAVSLLHKNYTLAVVHTPHTREVYKSDYFIIFLPRLAEFIL